MTLHDIILKQFNANQEQIAAYNADISNLLAMLTDLQIQQQVITLWLAANPQ